MTMLSSVADRLYWMSRYLERAEDTARLVAAYNHLIMDIPRGSEPPWDIMIRILDAEQAFEERYRTVSEQNVIKLLIADSHAPCSIPFAIKSARENVRTTRDVLPEDAWELVNELHLYVVESAKSSVGRRNRQTFLAEIIARCQMINGLLLSTLSRDHTYRFIKLGRLLECADMGTRVVDVGAGDILDRAGSRAAIDPLLWGALLQALSATSAYRREVGPIVEQDDVVNFVFAQANFPRSVKFCIAGIREELTPLRNNENALRAINRLRRRLGRLGKEALTREELHAFIDDFQLQLNALHQSISDTWFRTDGS